MLQSQDLLGGSGLFSSGAVSHYLTWRFKVVINERPQSPNMVINESEVPEILTPKPELKPHPSLLISCLAKICS